MFRKCLLVALVSCWPCVSAAQDLVVIASTGGTLEPGTTLNAQDIISLEAGQSLTLVVAGGEVINIEGPYQGPPKIDKPQPEQNLLDGVIEILEKSQSKRPATYRKLVIEEPPEQPPGSVNIAWEGRVCVSRGQPVALWRDNAGSDLLVSFGPEGASKSELFWGEGDHLIPWPRVIELQAGQRYELRKAGNSFSSTIDLIVMETEYSSEIHRLVGMSRQGCDNQAIEGLAKLKNQ